ncbi:MAG: YraN family protein [Bacteroidia bacterium]|nr:YraN family protein [Bacteroidia bacterium]
MATHNELGKQGEELAVRFLEAKGFIIFDQNYKYKKSEIDIVAFQDNVIHFVEVKTRSNTRFQEPEDFVTDSKIRTIAVAASFYLWERQMMTVPSVFDIVGISMDDPENPIFHHLENVAPPDLKFHGF